jgi:uncharacterized protein YjbJ (UPF0337 family)
MTDEHAKGAIIKVQGEVEGGLGKLTGTRRQQAKGRGRQIKGVVQEGLGDVQDAVREPSDKG